MTQGTTLIRGGTVFDGVAPVGRASNGVVRDVLLGDGRILDVGERLDAGAGRTIDATGAWVMPGFVDSHSHGDISVLDGSTMELRARAGVTTEVVGQDGLGFAPANESACEIMSEVLAPILDQLPDHAWASVADYLSEVDRGAFARVAILAPHGTLRANISGRAERPLDQRELDLLQTSVSRAASEGAVGLSTGLSYPPALWSTTDEVVHATAGLPPCSPYVTHLRDYGSAFDSALDEAITISTRSHRPLHLSHFHVSGPGRDGRAGHYVAMLDGAIGSGMDITWDSYPYAHACTFLTTVLPPRLLAMPRTELLSRLTDPTEAARMAAEIDAAGPGSTVAVGWDRLLLAGLEGTAIDDWANRPIGEVARQEGRTPGAVVLDVVAGLKGHACVLVEQGHRANIVEIAAHAAQVGGSDGIPGCGSPHPRISGSFLRLLRWSRDGVLPVPVGDVVAKLTSRAAEVFGLPTGRLVAGAPADLLVIDPDRLEDGPDIGAHLPGAVRHSFIAGEAAIDDGRWLAPRLTGLALRSTR